MWGHAPLLLLAYLANGLCTRNRQESARQHKRRADLNRARSRLLRNERPSGYAGSCPTPLTRGGHMPAASLTTPDPKLKGTSTQAHFRVCRVMSPLPLLAVGNVSTAHCIGWTRTQPFAGWDQTRVLTSSASTPASAFSLFSSSTVQRDGANDPPTGQHAPCLPGAC